ALAGAEFGGAHVIEEDERPDHAALRGGQGAPHEEAAEVAGARHDHALDRVAAVGVAGDRVLAGKEAHGAASCDPVSLISDPGVTLTPRGDGCKRARGFWQVSARAASSVCSLPLAGEGWGGGWCHRANASPRRTTPPPTPPARGRGSMPSVRRDVGTMIARR